MKISPDILLSQSEQHDRLSTAYEAIIAEVRSDNLLLRNAIADQGEEIQDLKGQLADKKKALKALHDQVKALEEECAMWRAKAEELQRTQKIVNVGGHYIGTMTIGRQTNVYPNLPEQRKGRIYGSAGKRKISIDRYPQKQLALWETPS